MTASGNNQAIVIGGSMAGLLAARVLADAYDTVIIVERDRLPPTPQPRSGVPQSSHLHVLLVKGQQILEQLFPGLAAELTAAGAPTVDWTADCAMLGLSGWEPRFHSGLLTCTCSRQLLEWTVRQRLTAYSNVYLQEGCQVIGLLTNASQTKMWGVRVRDRALPPNTNTVESTLPADLVVDASGRHSQLPQWLEELGYPPPPETRINSFLGYASRWYQRPNVPDADWKSVVVWPKPPDGSRAGILYPIEDERWIVTVAGVGGDYPPTDEAGFVDFTRSLRSPILYEIIKDAQPLSPIYGYRRAENRLRHYERLARLPEGLVAIGDAVCAFNPIYGQGMTAAAMSALTLARCLSEQSQHRFTGFAYRFQHQLAKVNATAWMMATSEDLRWATTKGGQPTTSQRLLHWYLDQVRRLTVEHPDALQAFMEVLHLIKPPATLFQPAILVPVLQRASHAIASNAAAQALTLPKRIAELGQLNR